MAKFRYFIFGMAALLAAPVAAPAAESCGWIENPKAGYWYFIDGRSRWALAEGADYEAEGFGLIPDLYSGDYEPINNFYGYTCGCMDIVVDDLNAQVTRINSYVPAAMSFCDANENLPKITGDQ